MFMDDNFMLATRAARRLYNDYAAGRPIIDYHCHLPVAQIAHNKPFDNLTAIWLAGDHYKWRVLRTNGVEERFITGDANDWERFEKWAETVPMALGNPVYHWTHMELKEPFGLKNTLLNPATAKKVWKHCNARLATSAFTPRGLMAQANVHVVCTTDDPVDSLEHHASLAADKRFKIRVRPTFRPDKALAVDSPVVFNMWLDALSTCSGQTLKTFDDLLAALKLRHDYFHSHGCRLSDHAMEVPHGADYNDTVVRRAFSDARRGRAPAADAAAQFKAAVLHELCRMNAARGWTQQFHIGALRNNNSRMMQRLGPDTGFDAIADGAVARPLARLMDRLAACDGLAKTIIYNLNPRDNELLVALMGCFQDGSVAGKIQFGSAWWFLDQKDGMERQITSLANLGLLSRFVGMLTDSRSFLSYSRHDYFRRILCNMLGSDMEKGLLPTDWKLIGSMVTDICHRNAEKYFEL